MNENISQKSERHPGVYYRAKAGSEQVFISYEEWAQGQDALSWDTKGLGGSLYYSCLSGTWCLIMLRDITEKAERKTACAPSHLCC